MFLKDRGGAGPDLHEAHLLESDEQICAAVLSNRPLNVRARYTDPAEKTKVVMNYPVRCSNSASKQQRWRGGPGTGCWSNGWRRRTLCSINWTGRSWPS